MPACTNEKNRNMGAHLICDECLKIWIWELGRHLHEISLTPMPGWAQQNMKVQASEGSFI